MRRREGRKGEELDLMQGPGSGIALRTGRDGGQGCVKEMPAHPSRDLVHYPSNCNMSFCSVRI